MPIPDWLPGSGSGIYPAEQANIISSDNNVVIDYDPTDPTTTDPGYVYGGLAEQGDSINNTVVIVGVSMDGNVTGGFSANNGDAANNSVTVSGGTVSGDTRGGYSTGGNADGNTVTVNGGLLNGFAYGGYTAEGDASGNAVALNDGGIARGVRGGQSVSGDAVNNSVTVSGGTVSGGVRGGWTMRGNASGNSILVSGGGITNGMEGGYSSRGEASNNTITVTGGAISGDVRGGWSNNGSVTGNTVTVGGGLLNDTVFGGNAASGDVSDNAVVLNDGGIARGIRGGSSAGGSAKRNSVTINGGIVSGDIRGGFSSGGDTADNTVTVAGGAVNGQVYGGWSSNSDAVGNKVLVSDGTVSGTVSGGHNGNGGSVIGNVVTVTGGTISGNARGGNATNGNASYNIVNISGGTVSGYARGGNTASGHALYNSVNITGGTVNSDVRGGSSSGGNASYNSVTVSDGSVAGDVYGGYASDDATNNVVTLTGALGLASSVIYGGFSTGGEDALTGNTLNVRSTGIAVAGVGNFETLNFWLPGGAADGDTMLFVTNAANLTGVTATVLLQGNSVLDEGYKIALLDNTAGGLTGTADNGTSLAMLGSTVLYDFDIYTDSDILWAELTRAGASPRARALTASRLAPLAFLAQGADLVSSLEYLEVSRDKESGGSVFAGVTGGSSTYEAGSGGEIDVDGFSLIAGVMWDAAFGKNNLQLRAFIEAGRGDYDTGGSLARASGDMDYYGGGLYMRYSWLTEERPRGLYADASMRMGRIDTDFCSSAMTNNDGVSAGYDTDSTYYGAHVGLGWVWRIGDRTSLDLSGKLLWTRLEDSSFTMSAGDRVYLDSANSSRFRAGFRVTRDSTERLSLFCGAYYEYEFDGDADGRLYGVYGVDRSSLSGGTGIGELGVILRPAGGDRLTATFGLQGYAGTREGFSGKLALQYAF